MRTKGWLAASVAATLLVCVSVPASVSCQRSDGNRVSVESFFTPSGWMGDGEYGTKYVQFAGADRTMPHSPPSDAKVTYVFGPNRWAGIYWQNIPDNWGDKPGADLSGKGLSRVSFWARGETGTEVVEFKVGGIDNRTKKYRDSLVVTSGRQLLTRDWKQYTIDLRKSNLTSVIGVFGWVASQDFNPGERMTFYLDDVYVE